VITDKLASYPPAIRTVLPNSEHRRHKRLNNRAENSYLPTRKRERILQRFKSAFDNGERSTVSKSQVSRACAAISV
jgi:putative transposase